MSRKFKGGFRNNGQPRVTLVPGLTRVAQLKAALREVSLMAGAAPAPFCHDIHKICYEAIEGTFVPSHLRRP